MKTLTVSNFNRAREFVAKKARAVDAALFAYSFENEKPAAVWEALESFSNSDGGFGHGMEPDCRLPFSSTLGTIAAFPYLLKTDAPSDHPLVRNGIGYLLETYDSKLKGWPQKVPDDGYLEKELPLYWGNPGGEILGYLWRYKELVPPDFLDHVTRVAMDYFRGIEGPVPGFCDLCFLHRARFIDSTYAGEIKATDRFGNEIGGR